MKLKVPGILATCLFSLLMVKPVAANDMINPAVLTNQQALELVLASMQVWVEGDANDPRPQFITSTADIFNMHEPFMRGNLPANTPVEISYGSPGPVVLKSGLKVRPAFGSAIVSHTTSAVGNRYRGHLVSHQLSHHSDPFDMWRAEARVTAPYFADPSIFKEYRAIVLYAVKK